MRPKKDTMKKSEIKIVKSEKEFRIEKGIPIPSCGGNRVAKPSPYEDIFKAMKKGDSFLCGGKLIYKNAYYHARRWGKANNATFVFRETKEGYRCWRVK